MTYYRLQQIRGIDCCLAKVLAARNESSRRGRGPAIDRLPWELCHTPEASAALHQPCSLRDTHQHPLGGIARCCLAFTPPCQGWFRQHNCWRGSRQAALLRQSSRGACEPQPIVSAENCQMLCHINCHSSCDTSFRIS